MTTFKANPSLVPSINEQGPHKYVCYWWRQSSYWQRQTFDQFSCVKKLWKYLYHSHIQVSSSSHCLPMIWGTWCILLSFARCSFFSTIFFFLTNFKIFFNFQVKLLFSSITYDGQLRTQQHSTNTPCQFAQRCFYKVFLKGTVSFCAIRAQALKPWSYDSEHFHI